MSNTQWAARVQGPWGRGSEKEGSVGAPWHISGVHDSILCLQGFQLMVVQLLRQAEQYDT